MNNKNLILVVGLISYLYLFNSLVNNNFYIIFTYFLTLSVGYLVIKEKIYLVNFVIIITDIINKLYHKNIIENNASLEELLDSAPNPRDSDHKVDALKCIRKDDDSCIDEIDNMAYD